MSFYQRHHSNTIILQHSSKLMVSHIQQWRGKDISRIAVIVIVIIVLWVHRNIILVLLANWNFMLVVWVHCINFLNFVDSCHCNYICGNYVESTLTPWYTTLMHNKCDKTLDRDIFQHYFGVTSTITWLSSNTSCQMLWTHSAGSTLL